MPAWIGFIDIDEFLVIKDKPKDVPLATQFETWAAKAPNTGALVFHWALFGSNGHTNVQEGNYNVLSRFTKRARELNPLVKWFVRPEALKYMVSPHHGELHAPYVARDVLGRPVPEAYDHDPARELCLPIACLHHYFTKSREEFKRKCERGRADLTEKRTMDDFDRHDLNEVEDISALAFATGVIQNKN
jgi:hypothetical protein